MAEAKTAPQGDPDSEQLRELKLMCMANLLSTAEERVYFKDLESRFLFVSAGWLAAYAPDRSAGELAGKTDFDVFSHQHAADAFADEQEIIHTGKPIAGQVERETSIIGYIELLREEGVDGPNTGRFTEVIGRNAATLLRLVGDLLFLSRMQSGQLALEYQVTNLAEAAAGAVAEARPGAQLKNIDLILSAAAVPPFTADPSRIGQLLGNIISNAVKFTAPGGRVEVKIGEAAGQAIVTVSDTGMGIPAADLERIFERFYRTSAATKQAIPGTGLGLAIGKAIVEAHNGHISVDSTAGLGSTFTVLLPLRPVPAMAGDPARAPRSGR